MLTCALGLPVLRLEVNLTASAQAETESKRQEAEVRLRTQSNELKRFHDKICMRVMEQERRNRLEAQRAQEYLVREAREPV